MRKFLIYVAVLTLVVGGFIIVTLDVPNWRLYDSRWRPLAMTEAENYCAGWLFGSTLVNREDPSAMADCIERNHMDNETPNVARSVEWGCQGVLAGLAEQAQEWDMAACLDAVEGAQVWFLMNGGYTVSWAQSGSNKRPVVAQTDITRAPRGERSEESGRF